MDIAAIPPMTLPMIAPMFDLFVPFVPTNAGVVVIAKELLTALVGPLAEIGGAEGLSILPGPTSGESINNMPWT